MSKNIYQRIHAVMKEIETIEKRGFNSFHKYEYATEADYVHALRPLLDKHGLVVIPNLVGDVSFDKQESDKGDNYLTSIKMAFTIVNVDNPEEKVTACVPAQGQDKGDKGVYKAITGAKKYFVALTFMVATGDDPEKDDDSSRRPVSKYKRGKRQSSSSEDDIF